MLGDFSSLDFTEHAKAVKIGEEAARGVSQRLVALGVTDPEYARVVAAHGATRDAPPIVSFVRAEPGSERYSDAIDGLFSDQLDKPVNATELGKRVNALYGQGNLEIMDYRVVQAPPGEGATPGADAEYGLSVTARRNSWGPNYLRFGLQLQNDFEGNSSFNAAARATLAEITRYGGEWVWDLQIGETPLVNTEVYLPFGYRSPWFLAPHAGFEIRTLPVADENENILAEYRVRTTNFGIDFGRELSNFGEVRVGWGRNFGKAEVRVGDPTLAQREFDSRTFFAEFRYDSVDDVNFPRHGGTFQLGWQAEREGKGVLADADADLVTYDQLYAHSWGRNTGVLWASAGVRTDNDIDIVRSFFSLGGFLNMSGVTPETLVGPNFAILRGIYYRQIAMGGPGFFDVPVYVGGSIEQGNVWNDRRDISFDSAVTNGSLFVGADTVLGPIYFATGFDDEGLTAYYLFLGRTF
jgi:NTE family protein